MTAGDLVAISREPNVAAFLRVVRAGESGQSDTAYRVLYGGQLFNDLTQHPRVAIRSPWGWTSAAGAYQIVATVPGRCKVDTWDGLVQRYGFADFSPQTQDAAAVALIIRRGALDAVRAGQLDQAISACAKEWASLPGSPYGQPTRTLEHCRKVYADWGGRLEPQAAPIEESQPTVVKPEPPAPPPREVGTVELVTSIWRALRSGYKLANSEAWKNRQIVVNSLTGLLGGAVAIAKALGHDLPVSDSDVAALAGAAAVLVGLFNGWATAATTGAVGLPTPRDRDPGGGA